MNWTFYKITGKTENVSTNGNRYYKFDLDRSVDYKDEAAYYINASTNGYSNFDVGDGIQIDTGKLLKHNKNDVFGFNDMVLCFSSSHWEDKYQQLAREKNNLISNLERQVKNWKEKYDDKSNELNEYKEGREKLYSKLNELQDERLKEVKQSAQDLFMQKEKEAKLKVELEKKIKELQEKLNQAQIQIPPK